MRKILLATLTATALIGWTGTAAANPPAAPSGHGEEHHDGKNDHKADKKGHAEDGHHDGKDGEHHGDKHEAEKPKS